MREANPLRHDFLRFCFCGKHQHRRESLCGFGGGLLACFANTLQIWQNVYAKSKMSGSTSALRAIPQPANDHTTPMATQFEEATKSAASKRASYVAETAAYVQQIKNALRQIFALNLPNHTIPRTFLIPEALAFAHQIGWIAFADGEGGVVLTDRGRREVFPPSSGLFSAG